MYKIFIERLICEGIHGVYPTEHTHPQRFQIDIQMSIKALPASDEFEGVTDYSQVKNIVEEVIRGPRKNLLETLAQEIQKKILDNFPEAVALEVQIRKLDIFSNAIAGISLVLE